MHPDQEVITLLKEIRDSQQALLNGYSRVANDALALQRKAYATQQKAVAQQREAVQTRLKHVRLYRWMLLIALPVVAYLIWRIFSLPI